jgi:hypothetical protein
MGDRGRRFLQLKIEKSAGCPVGKTNVVLIQHCGGVNTVRNNNADRTRVETRDVA